MSRAGAGRSGTSPLDSVRTYSLSAFLIALAIASCTPPEEALRTEVIIDGPSTFPENITSARDGSLFTGSVGSGGIFRAAPGETVATQWIAAGDNGLLDTFGVLADEEANILWVCSSRMDPPASEHLAAIPALFRYDLKTGDFRSKHPFPGGTGLCNDIALGPDGAAYVSDTTGGRILRLPSGKQHLVEWSKSTLLDGADGLAFLGQQLFVNSFTSGKLFRIDLKPDGSAGTPESLRSSRPLTRPDGMRRLNSRQFILAEGAGTVDLLTVEGEIVDVQTLRSGLIGPAGVTITGRAIWALESKLSMRGKPGTVPAPFRAYAIPLPTN